VSEEGVERRLTTILAADVVGYSRLMGEDEAATVAALKALRKELIEPKEAQYHGRTVKLMGDGTLMEFGSVVDAVAFAVEVQAAMQERNAGIPEDRQIVYRIGINIGDIIVEGDDIYGDGVNVASRLEGLAEPGGICVRRNVRNQVRDKLDLAFKDLGEIDVKNIARPVRVFCVVLDDKAAALATPVMAVPSRVARFKRWQVAAGLAIGLAGIGGLFVWHSWTPHLELFSSVETALPLPDKPSIAVLPFANVGGDPEQEYFADGYCHVNALQPKDRCDSLSG
jgi:class 3 adenylate cyclase